MTKTTSDARAEPRWETRRGSGPVFATAVHAGHALRAEVAELSALTPDARRREEDPLTDVLASVGDQLFVSRASRFEVDLNRPTEEAVYRVPDDAWGLELWKSPLPEHVIEDSLAAHARFYAQMGNWLEELIETHGQVLLLDVHSYNHRRDGADNEPMPQADNPDIDLGLTTADRGRFGDVIDVLAETLAAGRLGEGTPDVRENVRFPDGGNWPEWVYAQYGAEVCTITLEYKKTFMEEWSGQADLARLEQLRAGLAAAVEAVRPTLR